MQTANADTARVLDVLTNGLQPGGGRYLDVHAPVYAGIAIRCTSANLFTTSKFASDHFDMEPETEVTWWKTPESNWIPISAPFAAGLVIFDVVLETGKPVSHDPQVLKELVEFCDVWIGQDIARQYGGVDALAVACQSGDHDTF